MKDYRSLEHKIRAMLEARNSEARKKVVNVARPDDANPMSDRSKLAKQGEIKTKIIDEHNSDNYDWAKHSHFDHGVHAAHEQLRTGVKAKPYHTPGSEADKEWHRGYNSVIKHHAKMSHDAHTHMEQTVAEDNSQASTDIHSPIKDMEKTDKKKKGDMNDMDAKEIKGGKTEVNLNPTTDDRPEDQNAEDQKSKSATAKANKEIGAKSGKLKEEALDELSKETLQSYKEKSSMPKPNEPPRQSLNRMVGMARAMRKITAKEEVEQIDEKNWIAGAIKKTGALHKQLHVPADEKIPAEKLNAAAKKGGKLGQRARLAKTLKRIVKGK